MGGVDELLALVDDPRAPALTPGDPVDNALLALLAQVAFADGEVDDSEVAFLQRVLPGRDAEALRAWAVDMGSRPLDLAALAQALPSPDERWKGLRFAIRMAWRDGALAAQEEAYLARLVSALELPAGSLARAMAEVSGRGSKLVIDPGKLNQALDQMRWDSVQIEGGAVDSDLAEIVPPEVTLVARVLLDDQEYVLLCTEGLAGRFREGRAWLPWREIVTYTRQPVLGSAVMLHTEDGHRWTFADFRMTGIGMLLDRLYGAERPTPGPSPVITQLRPVVD